MSDEAQWVQVSSSLIAAAADEEYKREKLEDFILNLHELLAETGDTANVGSLLSDMAYQIIERRNPVGVGKQVGDIEF